MPRYSINGTVVGSAHFGVVVADDETTAMQIAKAKFDTGICLCGHCADIIIDPEITRLSETEVDWEYDD